MRVKIYGAGNAFSDFMSVKPDHIEVEIVYSIYGNETTPHNVKVTNDLKIFKSGGLKIQVQR